MLNKDESFVWRGIKLNYYDFKIQWFIVSKKNLFKKKYKFVYIWIKLRFELCFWKDEASILEKYKKEIINSKDDVEKILLPPFWCHVVITYLKNFIPTGKKLKRRALIFIYLQLAMQSYRGYRHFLCLPVRGNRTWSNRNCQRKKPKVFWEYYKSIFFKRRGDFCIDSRKNMVMYAEFVNNVYFHHFKYDWDYARGRRLKFIKEHKYVTWKYDLRAILANRAYIYTEKKEIIRKNKKRKNKKKVKIKNNLFNVGFFYNFTRALQRTIFKGYFVLKKTQKIYPKKKKKKK